MLAFTTYSAQCHCGAVRAQFRTCLPTDKWRIRECQCSFCLAHGMQSVSDPKGELVFDLQSKSRFSAYQFGTRSAEFLVCGVCGVYVGARMTTDAGSFGILNVRALRPIPTDLPASVSVDYSTETEEGRRARRQMLWTPIKPL
jgi:hypothetical protein